MIRFASRVRIRAYGEDVNTVTTLEKILLFPSETLESVQAKFCIYLITMLETIQTINNSGVTVGYHVIYIKCLIFRNADILRTKSNDL